MRLRLATLEDCDLLAQMHAQNFSERWASKSFRQILASPAAAVIAEQDGAPSGFLLFRIAADEAEILTIAVCASQRRRGIGQELVRYAADSAARRGANTIFLEVNTKNAAALGLYDKLGFLRAGQRTAYYQAKDAPAEDAYILKATLPLTAGAWETAVVRYSSAAGTLSEGMTRIEKLCNEKGLRMTDQRRVIARVLSEATDHPDAEELYRRAAVIDPHISIATVYRTVRLFEDAGILERHDFRDGRSRYEEMPDSHHDHLIDVQTGRVIEFRNEEIEKLQRKVAEELGFELVDHRLELYAVPRKARKSVER